MKIMIINGPNLNLLGLRNKKIYGVITYDELKQVLNDKAKELGLEIEIYHSNEEGKLINYIHQAIINDYDGIIINAGAYTHTSYAICDALEIFEKTIIEVHLSNIYEREYFRQKRLFASQVTKCYYGEQEKSYVKALEFFKK